MIYRRDGKIIGRNIISSHIFWALCPSAPAGKRPASTLPQDLALTGEIWFFSISNIGFTYLWCLASLPSIISRPLLSNSAGLHEIRELGRLLAEIVTYSYRLNFSCIINTSSLVHACCDFSFLSRWHDKQRWSIPVGFMLAWVLRLSAGIVLVPNTVLHQTFSHFSSIFLGVIILHSIVSKDDNSSR